VFKDRELIKKKFTAVTNVKKYFWQNPKLKKPNIATKQMLEPNVTAVVETRSKPDTIAIEVDK
jgi:hypothetical protein